MKNNHFVEYEGRVYRVLDVRDEIAVITGHPESFVEPSVSDGLSQLYNNEILRELLRVEVSEEDKFIIIKRFGLDGGKPLKLREISELCAKKFNHPVTDASAIRQKINKQFAKIRKTKPHIKLSDFNF